ncbi:uncharacterized mitochondrial protein-like protein [Tanacetum coccineum]
MESQSETTQTVSALKLTMLKIGDYDLWSMRIEQYLTHIDYALWEVIVNSDAPAITSASAGTEGPIPPKNAEQKLARKNELKAKSTLLLAISDENLLKFHGIKDAKTLWEAIKISMAGGDAYHEGEEIHKEDKRNLNFNGKETVGFDKQSPPSQKEGILTKKSAAKINNFNEKGKTARINNVTTTGPKAVVSAACGNSPHSSQDALLSDAVKILMKIQQMRAELDNLLVQQKEGYANNTNKRSTVVISYTQEEGIDYDEVFTTVARIEEIRLFLAYASYMGFIVYQMDVKSAFLYGTIKEEVYLTAFRPDIMFVVCACARFQVTPKVSHLHVVRRIFRYLKGQPKLGLWYPRDSPFNLEAFSDSDYAGASLDKKSTIGDETVYKEWEDKMERAITTASSLKAEQDHEDQIRFEAVSKQSNDPPLSRDNTLIQEASDGQTTSSPLQASKLPQAKDKGKAIMVEHERPLKKKDQVALDEEIDRNLKAQMQAELDIIREDCKAKGRRSQYSFD